MNAITLIISLALLTSCGVMPKIGLNIEKIVAEDISEVAESAHVDIHVAPKDQP